jgi:hypothetical protein
MVIDTPGYLRGRDFVMVDGDVLGENHYGRYGKFKACYRLFYEPGPPQIKVTSTKPDYIIKGIPTQIIINAEELHSHKPISANVTIDNKVIGKTNVPFTYTANAPTINLGSSMFVLYTLEVPPGYILYRYYNYGFRYFETDEMDLSAEPTSIHFGEKTNIIVHAFDRYTHNPVSGTLNLGHILFGFISDNTYSRDANVTSSTTNVPLSCTFCHDDANPIRGYLLSVIAPGYQDTLVPVNLTGSSLGHKPEDSNCSLQDTIPPTVTGTPDRIPDSQTGWYNHSLTVKWTGIDNSNGTDIGSCDAQSTYAGPDGASTKLTGSCVDKAGNKGQGNVIFNYDATKPHISSNQEGRSFVLKQKINSNFQCDDSTSGIASGRDGCKVSTAISQNANSISRKPNQNVPIFLDTSSIGSHLYNVTAKDKAGNNMTLPIHYNVIYNFVRVSPLQVNKINATEYKAGSNILVAFKLLDAISLPQSTATAKIFVDGLPAKSSTTTKLGNTFRYDVVSKQYRFTLSTVGLSADKPHIITIKIANDGTSHMLKIVPTILSAPTPQTQTSNFLTYENHVLGTKVQYPSGWKIQELTNNHVEQPFHRK